MKPATYSRSFRFLVCTGAITALLAVLLGAFAAHGLRQTLDPGLLNAFETGVHYQMTHALGIILVAILSFILDSRWLRAAGWCLLAGIVLFSGSLYLLALSGIRWIGAITPMGGIAFIAGWALVAVGAWRMQSSAR